ncbi:fumarylacetoacetate hydrolase family protein [Nonomuraea sp. K274]|uniref:Fumarylacetoacetate hydrolase family protein n=1 Tax=Nonomuraea cypriaca TaxID=1187855 RepID=A0A931EUQ1_9ACTN|nr:fumarylacetoacetate hydrolase family protein [Nonomuraea cypriaca]MBF8184789.1 fumarylacetoacetate hydrolase family protein [Nonomuraea cypriaca]
MRLIGYRTGKSIMVARILDTGTVQPIAPVEEFWDDPFRWGADAVDGDPVAREGLEIVPPVLPSARVICVGLNYAEHAAEGRWDPPKYPTVFARWTASLSTDGVPVAVPPGEQGLDWEAELVAIVGRPLYRAAEADTAGAVYGYAPFNDLTARRSQKLTTQWTLGKNADGSGPLGPIMTSDQVGPIDGGLRIEARVNGEVVQSDSTRSMIFSIDHLLSFLSQGMTLHPGDLIATGTPSGVGYVRNPPRFLTPGDLVEVEIERVGSVSTPVISG